MSDNTTTKPGCFITIEGVEGVGKTTNIEFIAEYLSLRGRAPLLTREPGGTDIAEKIRELLLNKSDEALNDDAELLLVFAARAQHLSRVIQPAISHGEWVVCDRFTDATYAYQGGGRGLSEERITQLENWVQGELRPDFTLLLDLPVEIGLERAGQRSAPDRFESERIDFFERVRAAYLKRAAQYPNQFKIVDASQSIEGVQRQLEVILEDICNQWERAGGISH